MNVPGRVAVIDAKRVCVVALAVSLLPSCGPDTEPGILRDRGGGALAGTHAVAGSAAVGGRAAGSMEVNGPVAPNSGVQAGSGSMAAGSGGAANAVLATPIGPRAEDILRSGCKKSTVESNLLPANILFVLDRSGSMLCNPPPTTLSSVCEQQPTRDNANSPSKWEITTQALIKAVRALPGSATIGLSYFANDDECGVNSLPSVPLLANSSAQQQAIETSIRSVSPGGGTPIVGATILAYAHMHASALAGKIYGNEFVVLITDGAQSEQCSFAPRCSSATSCTDVLINEEVAKAAGRGVGIRTFVVGVPGSEPARTVLSQIAKLGGSGPANCDPQQGNCHFDMTKVTDLSAALNSALAEIAGQAVSCELNVPKPDQGELDPTLVNVVYTPSGGRESVVVRQDLRTACNAGANGWQYADANSKIRLCGDICNAVRSDTGAKVDVVLGCPSILN
jgi:Mg-chelatase subunit ChlD